ncbi:MAG: metalloregulator ArsR/SmtB family transcription factor [Clostridia bacterium]
MKQENLCTDCVSCENCEIHDSAICKVRKLLPKEELLYDLAEFYKIFGDSTRIKILYALFESELCVCDLAEVLGNSQSAISHQLRILKQSKLVKFRREGKTVFYSLADEHIFKILDQGMTHICE